MSTDDETFVCECCETRRMEVDSCEHDPKFVHNWCMECCESFHTEDESRYDWNDLD